MLESIRKNSKHPIFKGLFALLIIAFAISGVNMAVGGSAENYVAKVGKTKISPQELERRFEIVLRSMGPEALKLNEEQLRSIGVSRDAVLKSVIQGEIIKNQVKELGIVVGDESLKRQIRKMPAFKGADGKFDAARFHEFLQSMGITEFALKKDLKSDIENIMIVGTINNAAPGSIYLNELVAKAVGQSRDVEIINIPINFKAASHTPTDSELDNFYFENSMKYQLPEQRSISVVRIPKPANFDQAFQDKVNKLEDDIASGANIREIAAKHGFVVETMPNITAATDIKPEKLKALAFTTQKGAVSSVTENEDGSYFFVQVDNVVEKSVPPIANVKAQVTADWKAKKQADETIKFASMLADEAKKAPDLAKFAAEKGVPYEKMNDFGDKSKPKYEGEFAYSVLTTPKGVTTGVVPVADKGFVIVRVADVRFPEVSAADIANAGNQLAPVAQEEVFGQYVAYLAKKYPVKINNQQPEQQPK